MLSRLVRGGRCKPDGLPAPLFLPEIVYTDITGEQETRLRLYITRSEDLDTHQSTYEIRGSALYDGVANIPAFFRAMVGDRRVLEPQPTGTSAHT